MVAFSAYPLDGLFDLGHREGVDIRPTLLRVLTDLYVQKPAHSDAEEAQYVELASRLIETVDAATRTLVAQRLARYSAAPAPVLAKLAPLVEGSAAPFAPVLSSADRLERTELRPRKLPTAQELAESFFSASTEERRFILTNLDAFIPVSERKSPIVDTPLIREIENAALKHDTAALVRLLERTFRITYELAWRAVNDSSGEPIVVVAKALRMDAAVLQRILLFINPHVGQSVARVFNLVALFEEITSAAAEDMIALWRSAGGEPRTHPAGQLWTDERARPRPSPAAVASHGSPAERRERETSPVRSQAGGTIRR